MDLKDKDKPIKKTVKDVFLNPITGNKEDVEVSVSVTDKQNFDLAFMYGINAEKLVYDAAHNEIAHQKEKKYYEAIKEYAENIGNNVVVNIKSDDKMIDNIWEKMNDVIMSSEKPKAIFDIGFATFMRSELNTFPHKDSEHQLDLVSHIFNPLIEIEYWHDNKQKFVNIYTNDFAPFSDMNVLIFDEINPKNCKFIIYKLDEGCYDKLNELVGSSDEVEEVKNED